MTRRRRQRTRTCTASRALSGVTAPGGEVAGREPLRRRLTRPNRRRRSCRRRGPAGPPTPARGRGRRPSRCRTRVARQRGRRCRGRRRGSIRGAAQGIESILVANRCLYRTIILGGASRVGIRAMAQTRATWEWGAMCAVGLKCGGIPHMSWPERKT